MLEVRWSSDEGTVMVVKELKACWKCAAQFDDKYPV